MCDDERPNYGQKASDAHDQRVPRGQISAYDDPGWSAKHTLNDNLNNLLIFVEGVNTRHDGSCKVR